jgi:hypothetical protein
LSAPSSEDAEGFRARLVSAARCPVPGPCPECASRAAHYCELGEQLRRGMAPHLALRDALAASHFRDAGKRLDPADARRAFVTRLCRAHRALAEQLFAADPRGAWDE